MSRMKVNASFSNNNNLRKYGKSGSLVGLAVGVVRGKCARRSLEGV